MFTLKWLDKIAKEAGTGLERLNTRILEALGKRILKATNTGGFDRFSVLGEADREAEKLYREILNELGRSANSAEEIYTTAAKLAYKNANKYYAAKGLEQIPIEYQNAIVNFVKGVAVTTRGTFTNLSNTGAIGFRVLGLDGKVTYKGFKQHYHDLIDQAITEVATGQKSYNSAFRQALKQTADSGIRVLDYESGYSRRLDSAMRQNVIDGVKEIAHEIARQTGEEFGADGVEIDAHNLCAPDHLPFQGRQFSKAEFDDIQENLPREFGMWNCVLGDTRLITPKIKAAFRRKYAGEIVVISTASGKRLSVTPNHPILTENGWVSAGLLREGDNVINGVFSREISNSCPDIHNSEPTIQEVFEALSKVGMQFREPAGACDFHGEIANEEVDIVLPKGFLNDGGDAFFDKSVVENLLGNTVHSSSFLFTKRSTDKAIVTPLHSSNFVVRSFSKIRTFFGRHSFKSIRHGLRSGCRFRNSQFFKNSADFPFRKTSNFFGNIFFPHSTIVHIKNILRRVIGISSEFISPASGCINTALGKPVLNSMETAPISISEFLHCPSLLKQLDNIVLIEKKSFVGHVYNLHTEGEWYSANGIITHNCRHTYYPILLGVSSPLYTEDERQAMIANSTEKRVFEGKEYTAYEATQLQRKIETEMRKSKDRAILAKAAGDDLTQKVEQLRLNQLKDKYNQITTLFKTPPALDRAAVSGFRPVGVKGFEVPDVKPKPTMIDFKSEKEQVVTNFGDQMNYYPDTEPGREYAVDLPVVYNEFAAKHLKSDELHSKRFNWLENNTSDFIRAISNPEIIENIIRQRKNGHYSLTNIVRVTNPGNEGWDYMVVAISLSKDRSGFHQITTIHPKRYKEMFKKDGSLRGIYIKVKK